MSNRTGDHSHVGRNSTDTTSSVGNMTLAEEYPDLHWGDIDLIGREAQVRALRECLNRVRQPGASAEAVWIKGFSGTGKSLLANSVMNVEKNLVFAVGKYDQRQEMPFSAISDLIEEIFGALPTPMRKYIEESFSDDELAAIGIVAPAICQFVSFKNNQQHGSTTLGDAMMIRFMRIFRRLLQAIASPELVVVLFLDDIQRADDASRKLIASILEDHRLTNILLIGAIRDGDESTFERPQKAVFPMQDILCDNLKLADVVRVIESAVGWTQEEAETLGRVVYNRTAGNPFFVIKFLEKIHGSRLLRYSEQTHTFTCDVDAVAARMPVSTSVLDLIEQKVANFNQTTQLILVIAAALGHTFESHVLEPILGTVELVSLFPSTESTVITINHRLVEKSLGKVCKAGLIEKTKKQGQYRFTHDKVQQCALTLLPNGPQGSLIQATLGSVMLELSVDRPDETWIRYAATNLLLKHQDCRLMEPLEIAETCLETAEIASKQAAFASGARYADAGIKTLGVLCWKEHYDLTLKLFDLSSSLHFSNGNFKSSKKRGTYIRNNAKCMEDKIPAYFVSLHTLCAEDNFEACVSEGVSGLQSLKIKIAKKSSTFNLITNLIKTKRMFKNMTPDDVLDLPAMTDKKMEDVAMLVGIVAAAAFDAGDVERCVACCLQQFQMTLKHGLSVSAARALASYGVALSFIGDFEGAFECGRAAAELMRKYEEGFAYASLPLYTGLWHLKRPLVECYDTFVEAAEVGMKCGDSYHACFAIRFHGTLGFFVGKSLSTFESEMKQNCETLKEYRQHNHLAFLKPWAQLIENIRGKADDLFKLKGTFMDEKNVSDNFEKTNAVHDRNLVLMVHHARMVLLFLCGQFKMGEEDRKLHEKIPPEAATYIFKLTHAVFCALNCYALAIETGIRRYISRSKPYIALIKSFGKVGSPNTVPMLALLEAEEFTFRKKFDNAAVKYQEAISGFQSLQFYLLEAIAFERMGLALETKDRAAGRLCLAEAYRKFSAYGATVKVRLMEEAHGSEIDIPSNI